VTPIKPFVSLRLRGGREGRLKPLFSADGWRGFKFETCAELMGRISRHLNCGFTRQWQLGQAVYLFKGLGLPLKCLGNCIWSCACAVQHTAEVAVG
jgi:hypothetical protein